MCPTYTTTMSEGCYLHQCRQCEWSWVTKYEHIGYNCKSWGTLLTSFLAFFGVTQDRVNRVFGLFGKKCHCTKWRNRMNSRR